MSFMYLQIGGFAKDAIQAYRLVKMFTFENGVELHEGSYRGWYLVVTVQDGEIIEWERTRQ